MPEEKLEESSSLMESSNGGGSDVAVVAREMAESAAVAAAKEGPASVACSIEAAEAAQGMEIATEALARMSMAQESSAEKVDEDESAEFILEVVRRCEKFLFSLECAHKGCPLVSQREQAEGERPASAHLRLYSNALVCVALHQKRISKVGPEDMIAISLFETLLLKGRFDKLPKKLVDRTRKCMDAYCEQDMESLTVKMYGCLGEKGRERVLRSPFLHAFLKLLKLRKETERFFKVYDQADDKNDIEVYRMALLTSMVTEYRDPRHVLKDIRKYLGIPEDAFNTAGPAFPGPALLEYESIKKWFSDEYRKHHWSECIRIWKASKEIEGTGESMIDVCVKYKEFEEGWRVYREVMEREAKRGHDIQRLSMRACYLAIRAANTTCDKIWTDRFLAITAAAVKETVPAFMKQALLLLRGLEDERAVIFLTSQILKMCGKVSLTGEGVRCTLEGCFCLLEGKCEMANTPLGNACIKEVFDLYVQWKKTRRHNSFLSFFTKSSECTNGIYKTMLGLCCKCQIEEVVKAVCEDIWNSGLEMDEEILGHLRVIHSGRCSCDRFQHLTGKKGHGRNILGHCVKLLKKQPPN